MKAHEKTQMGGPKEAFETTEWTYIVDLKSDPAQHENLINYLISTYWKPVYCYLRRKGYQNEQAKDLTQDFFCEVVISRDLAVKMDRTKGRFRAYLLTALNRYLINAAEKQNAQKRMPASKIVSLNQFDMPDIEDCSHPDPEHTFNYHWLASMLEEVLNQVEALCRRDQLSVHWQVFNERILQPILNNTQPPSMDEICRALNIENPAKASNMTVTVKRRFQNALKRAIRNSVSSEGEFQEELDVLLSIFPKLAQDN